MPMQKYPLVKASDVDVVLISPPEYEECVVYAETKTFVLFAMTDESRSGECMVEVATSQDERVGWTISLRELRSLLDDAGRRLRS